MTEEDLFKYYEAWKNEQMSEIDARVSEAAKQFAAADKALTDAFVAYDADKLNKLKENAWILALDKRNASAKRLDALRRKRELVEIEHSYKRFLHEKGPFYVS